MDQPEQQRIAGRPLYPLHSEPRNIDLNETKRIYLGITVANILAKARRECDDVDSITAAISKCKVSDDPPKPKNNEIQYKYVREF